MRIFPSPATSGNMSLEHHQLVVGFSNPKRSLQKSRNVTKLTHVQFCDAEVSLRPLKYKSRHRAPEEQPSHPSQFKSFASILSTLVISHSSSFTLNIFMMCLLHMTSCLFYHQITDQQQSEVWRVLPQNPVQTWSSNTWQPCPPQQHWYFGMSYKHLAILEAGRTILSPRISEKILCIFSVPNQACCAPDSPTGQPSIINASQMDKNSRRLKSPSYQTAVQLRKEGCHPLHMHSLKWECVRIVTNSWQPD